MAYEILELIRVDTGESHIIETQLRICQGLGAYGLMPILWSENNLLYYTNAREGVPDGMGFWIRPLIRLDTSDMEIAHLGRALLSPDTVLLATWDLEPNTLTVLYLTGEELAQFSVYESEMLLVEMLWLPDGSGLIYVLANSYIAPMVSRSLLVHVSLVNLEQTVLLETNAQDVE
jgi:hypothetical protein